MQRSEYVYWLNDCDGKFISVTKHNSVSSRKIFSFALCRSMDFSIKIDIVMSDVSIVYIEGSQVINSKNILYFFL